MFTTILIIIIILIGLFVFNERINQLVKSLFNSKIDRIEEENTDSILDQVTRKTRQKDAEINQAQAKIIAQMNTLKYQKQELEQIIIETQSKAKQLKDLYLTTNDESKKDLAIAVLETIADEKIQLASLEKTI